MSHSCGAVNKKARGGRIARSPRAWVNNHRYRSTDSLPVDLAAFAAFGLAFWRLVGVGRSLDCRAWESS